MQSAVAVTYELDDVELAASELAGKIRQEISLCANSVGILFCDSEMDHEGLQLVLKDELKIDIIGCTTIGSLDQCVGFHELCVTLAVLTGDDVFFSSACSEALTPETAEAGIEAAYLKALGALPGEPKLIYVLTRGKPGVMIDFYPEVLTRISGGVPVFGGVPSAGARDVRAVLADGGLHEERMAILLIAGNIRPIFNSRSVRLDTAVQKRQVVKAKDNIIYQVGEGTLLDFMKSLDMDTEFTSEEDRTHSFLSRPLFIEDVEKGISFVRVLWDMDNETGVARANGKVEEGTILSIGVLRKQDIEESAARCIDEMLEKIVENEKEGYKYSMILCTSCIGRFLLLATDRAIEGNMIVEAVKGRIQFAGFYSWGELCPLESKGQGLVNKSHDETISMCAI